MARNFCLTQVFNFAFNKTFNNLTGRVITRNLCTLSNMESKNIEINNDLEPPNKKLCLDNEEDSEKKRIKKRNVALLLAYSGVNYYGMQINGDFKTIESELIKALHQATFVPAEAVNDLHLIHFQRAARTDKGVSAVKQIVSFKIAENYNIDEINAHLPEDIKVFGIKRVTKGFNCKNQCFGRTYSYTMPSFAISPQFYEEYPENFRIDEQSIQNFNEILLKFLGTHPFHNFTSKKDSRDPSAKRYILNIRTEEPFIEREEFVTIKIKGQSFMLHQIRKMIGYAIAVMKGIADDAVQTKVWTSEKLSLPMVPGLGLVLEDVHYDKYNKKFGNDGMHTTITWDEVSDDLLIFKKKFILSTIIETELRDKQMFYWLQKLAKHKFTFPEKENLENGADEESSIGKVEEKQWDKNIAVL